MPEPKPATTWIILDILKHPPKTGGMDVESVMDCLKTKERDKVQSILNDLVYSGLAEKYGAYYWEKK